jgi:leucyl-tRNA synthetase
LTLAIVVNPVEMAEIEIGIVPVNSQKEFIVQPNFPEKYCDVKQQIPIPIDLVIEENGKFYFDKKGLEEIKKINPLVNWEFGTKEDFKEHLIENEFYEEIKNVENYLPEDNVEVIPIVEKMSKSKYNVVNPDDIIEQHGADALRLYEMFLGPLELSKPWNTNGISGTSNFIRKLWRLFHQGKNNEFVVSDEQPNRKELKSLHKLIKKVTEDIERFSFNTSVSNFMICVNELTDLKCNKRSILEPLVILVSPYAPHVAEELWQKLGHTESVTFATWPGHKEEYLEEDTFAYPISVNGKTKINLSLSLALNKEEIEHEVLNAEEVKKFLSGQSPKKVIVVPGRIVNIVL